jgi:poly(A) polymerase
MKDIWILQDKLSRRDGKRAFTAFEHPKFRAGYDFLLLRAEIEQTPSLLELAKWWTDFQNVSPETRLQMVKAIKSTNGNRRPTRKRRKSPAKAKTDN